MVMLNLSNDTSVDCVCLRSQDVTPTSSGWKTRTPRFQPPTRQEYGGNKLAMIGEDDRRGQSLAVVC